MTILLSNYQPAKFDTLVFNKVFYDLIKNSTQLDIAIGYISEKSLDHLADLIHKKGHPYCNLIIGMHYFEKFTYAQYVAAKEMDKFLSENNLGGVKLVTSFPYHGKVYSFKSINGEVKSIVGSSNLNNILPHKPTRQYELDILIDNQDLNNDLAGFIKRLSDISPSISSENLIIDSFKTTNNLMEGLADVKVVESEEYIASFKKGLNLEKTIHLPIKGYETAPQSNINAYFGKGRENKTTQIIRRRSWYEVELIVPKKITDLSWYPKVGYPKTESVITVLTDDGFQFKCKISGTNSKNFRSVGDLKILGKWLKGRLENAGVLMVDQKVTESVLKQYGRDYIEMIPTDDPDQWFLDFSRDGEGKNNAF
ncbi:MAG: NgoFVII family restriction endonuclease [Candidatus Paracaedibacteraceae bacterium]|nr:NgoFVII family restriction endonuclease [Candidatus Paracaedibacteraceae bacterium]